MLPLVTGEESPILCQKTQLVTDPLSPEIQELLPKMIKTMHKEHGVGLAAPQINIPLRLAVAARLRPNQNHSSSSGAR